MTTPKPVRGSLAVIFLTVFIDLLGFGMVLPLLPIYGEKFGASEAVLAGLMSSFSLMQFFFAPLWGRLSDRIGRRPVLLIGLAGSVVFYALFGVATVAQSIPWLFVARIGAGIAGATISTAQAYIADSTTLETRAKGMALIGAAFGLGFTFGPLFGSFALPQGGEDPGPGPGYLAAVFSAAAFALAWFKLPESLRPDSTSASRKLLDARAFWQAMSTPSIGPLLVALFTCILAFANFETTLSLLLKGDVDRPEGPFHFRIDQVGWTFAYVGLSLTFAQGFLVRRLAGRVSEGLMATTGGILDIVGFMGLLSAIHTGGHVPLFVALTLIVVGFALMMPSLNSLISRRSDPAKQGGVLGVSQSVSAMARILGPMLGIPLWKHNVFWPYWAAAGLMSLGLVMVVLAARGGQDYGQAEVVTPSEF